MKSQADALPPKLRAQFGSKVGRPDFDDGKPFFVDLPAGFKQEAATFDRFGLLNAMKEGGHVKPPRLAEPAMNRARAHEAR